MPVIAVVNRKGGSGKSTLATHIAAYCANAGIAVMLGDVDRQQSIRTWLRLREAQQPAPRSNLVGWAVDPKNALHVPAGVSLVVLDTPGGMHGFDLKRVVMFADAVLMPVCNSVFDRESAADCFAELMTMPRVASGRCQVAAVGMRLDSRTQGGEVLKEWADKQKLPFLGVLRETQAYVRCIERGLTLFDLPAVQVQSDLDQWTPILKWLDPIARPAPQAAEPAKRPTLVSSGLGFRASSLKPAAPPLTGSTTALPGTAGAVSGVASPPVKISTPAAPRAPAPAAVEARPTRMLGPIAIPRFLLRNP